MDTAVIESIPYFGSKWEQDEPKRSSSLYTHRTYLQPSESKLTKVKPHIEPRVDFKTLNNALQEQWFQDLLDRSKMLKTSLRAVVEPIPGSADAIFFSELNETFKGFPLNKASVTYDQGLFYYAMYLEKHLKVTLTAITSSGSRNLGVSFFHNGELVREDLMSAKCIAEVVKELMNRLDE